MAIDLITTDLTNLSSSSAPATINANFNAIEVALAKAIDRDGGSDNEMNADLDLDGNDIINVGTVNGVDLSNISGSVTVGTVTELSSDSSPTVVNSGTSTASILDFGFPAANKLSPRGEYSSGTTYSELDVVSNQNSSWVANQSTTGNAPPTLPTTSNTQWTLLASQGPAHNTLSQYGAVGDGTTDDTDAIKLAALSGTIVDLENKTYKLTSTVDTWTSETSFVNGKIDMSTMATSSWAFSIAGTTGTYVDLTASTAWPNNTVDVDDASTMPADTLVQFASTLEAVTGYSTTKHGEFATVKSVSSNELTLYGPLQGVLDHTAGAQARPITPIKNVGFVNVTFIGGGSTTRHQGVEFEYTSRCFAFGCSFIKTEQKGMQIKNSVGFRSDNTYGEDVSRSGFGYPISSISNQNCNFGDIVGLRCRHLFSGGGGDAPDRFINVGDVTGVDCLGGVVDTHRATFDCNFGNVTGTMSDDASTSDDAITMQGSRISVGDIKISNAKRHAVLFQHGRDSTPGRSATLYCGNIQVDGGSLSSQEYIMVVGAEIGGDLDYFCIDSISGTSEEGILIDASGGNIKKGNINGGNITIANGYGVNVDTSDFYARGIKIRDLDIDLSVTGFQAVFVNGTSYLGSGYGVEVELDGCTVNGLHSSALKVQDAKLTTKDFKFTGFTGKVTTSGTSELVNYASNIEQVVNLGTLTTNTALDFDTHSVIDLTLGANITLQAPTNVRPGQRGTVIIRQDATGNRTVSWSGSFKWENNGLNPVLSTAANAIDMFDYVAIDSTNILGKFRDNFKT